MHDKIRSIEIATIEGAWRKPDSQIVRTPGWAQVVTPSSREIWLNEVSFAALGAENADAAIAGAIARYREFGARFRWVVGPGSSPVDLGRRLEAHGLKLAYEMSGMLADPAKLSFEVPSDVRVEAASEVNIGSYIEAVVQGWGGDAENIPEIRSNMLRSLRDDAGRVFYYLAWVGDKPAGTAILWLTSAGGYLKGGSVDPKFRRRGVYRALLETRLAVLRELRSPRVLVCAVRDTSAPICSKLGFESVCTLRSYEGS